VTTRFTLNGGACESAAPDSTPLIDVLRDGFGCKSVRFGCGANQCGACHVLIDGRSQPACDTPLWAVAGRTVITVEGFGGEGAPHPLQVALLECQAAQCGYCLSGIQASAVELLTANPAPDEAQVRAALDRHLCRCGSHNRIVCAVLKAADALRAARPA
jgi:nicotinate dehydrogenase subunit A